MKFLKNYLLIFAIIYWTILTSKIIFPLYLQDWFVGYSLFEQIHAILWGYRFDFAVSALVAFFITLLDFNKRLLISLSGLAMVTIFSVQIADLMYFSESSRHLGYEVDDVLVDGYSLFMTVISQHMGLMVLVVIGYAFILFYGTTLLTKHLMKIKLCRWWLLQKLSLLLLSIFFIRGTTLIGIPLDAYHANQIGDTKLAMLSLNGTYNILYLFATHRQGNIMMKKLPALSNQTRNNTLHALYKRPPPATFAQLNKPNIVFLFLESWNGVHMNSYGFKRITTPFFDRMLKQSIRPKGMIAGGHRTSEGVFTTLTSQQNPLGQTVAQTKLQNYPYTSIVDIFNQDNYYTAFYQGSSKETSGVGSFVQKLGFKHSFGKRDIKKRQYAENAWGVHDSDLYQFVGTNLKNISQPFFIGINGATTHDEQIPQSIKKITLAKDKKLNNKLNALHFSDRALKYFVSTIKHRYPNTLFVFFSDHVGGVNGDNFDNYLIPFALYHPDLKPKYYDTFISQRDIAPTVLDLVYGNYRHKMPSASGKSLLSDDNFFADYYHNGVLGWIAKDQLVEYNLSLNQKICYKIIHYHPTKTPCTNKHNALVNQLIAFTNASQTLLFTGKTQQFSKLRPEK